MDHDSWAESLPIRLDKNHVLWTKPRLSSANITRGEKKGKKKKGRQKRQAEWNTYYRSHRSRCPVCTCRRAAAAAIFSPLSLLGFRFSRYDRAPGEAQRPERGAGTQRANYLVPKTISADTVHIFLHSLPEEACVQLMSLNL